MSTKYKLTEDKLLETIKTALRLVGRSFVRRANSSLQSDDNKAPNFYYWRFNPEYDYSFPKLALSKWSQEEYDACLEALEEGQVWVVAKDGVTYFTPSSPDEMPAPATRSDANMSQTHSHPYTAGNLPLMLPGDADTVEAPVSPTWNATDVTSDLDRLTTGLSRNAENHKGALALAESIKAKLQKTGKENWALRGKFEFFEKQMQQKIRDCEELNKKLKDIEERDVTGREDLDDDESLAFDIDALQRCLQRLSRQKEELNKAREEGYNEGRESITEEHEAVTAFREHYNLPMGRKTREFKTILANWKGVIPELFTTTFLREDKVPGDKTLILLAKLSKLLPDWRNALSLLKKEIDQRNRLCTGSSPDPGLTRNDVENVLSHLKPGIPPNDDRESHALSETSFSVNRQLLSTKRSFTHQSAPKADNLSSVLQDKCDKRHGNMAKSEWHGASNRGKSSVGNSSSQKRFPSLPNHTETVRQPLKPASNPDSRNPILEEPTTELRKSVRRSQSGNTQLPSDKDVAVLPDLQSIGPVRASETLEQILATFPPPPKAEVPLATEYLLYLLTDFVLKHIGGGIKAFSRIGAKSNIAQVVNWEWTIKIQPESQLDAPCLGTHGALHFVDGQDGTGEVGRTYPVLVNCGKAGYQYIGHYKVEKQVIMPLETWQNWPEERRTTVAKVVEETNWGRNIISDRGLCFKPKGSRESRVADVLSFFDRRAKPCMRMKWTILRLESFNQRDCQRLKEALQLYGRKGGKVQPWNSKLPQTVAVNHENTDRSATEGRLAAVSHSETRRPTENVISSASANGSLPPLSQTCLIQQLGHSKKRPHSVNDSHGASEIRPAKRMAPQFTTTQNESNRKRQSIPNTTQDTKSPLKNAFGLSSYLTYADDDPEDIYNASPPCPLRGSQQNPVSYGTTIRVEIPHSKNLHSCWRPRRHIVTELEEGETADTGRTDVDYEY